MVEPSPDALTLILARLAMTTWSQSDHQCPVARCPRRVPNRLLMCGIHWRLCPPHLQRAVNAAYDHGRGLMPNGLPGPALAAAQVAAVRAVEARLAEVQP